MIPTATQTAMFCSVPFTLIPETALLSPDDQAAIVEYGLDANAQATLLAAIGTGRTYQYGPLALIRSLARAQALNAADGERMRVSLWGCDDTGPSKHKKGQSSMKYFRMEYATSYRVMDAIWAHEDATGQARTCFTDFWLGADHGETWCRDPAKEAALHAYLDAHQIPYTVSDTPLQFSDPWVSALQRLF